jgi:hypothetical protein
MRTKLPASGPIQRLREERDCNDAIYIHRIATHFLRVIILLKSWTGQRKKYKSIGKDYIRLDTWVITSNITQIGFDFLLGTIRFKIHCRITSTLSNN